MQSWSVVEKFSLNCLLISISGNGTWKELEGGRQDGKKNEVFIFKILFVNRLYSFLPSSLLNARLHFHVIHPHLIIQHKVLFSSHFISSFLKNKIKYAISHVTFCCVYGYQT